MSLPSLDEPPAGSACPACHETLRIWAPAVCGQCGWREDREDREADHDRRRDDPLRLAEWKTILRLAEARRRAQEREREELELEAVYRYEQGRGHVI